MNCGFYLLEDIDSLVHLDVSRGRDTYPVEHGKRATNRDILTKGTPKGPEE